MEHPVEQASHPDRQAAGAFIPHNRPCLGDDDAAAAAAAVKSGWVASGPRVRDLEALLSSTVVGKPGHAAVCSSGSAALFLALRLLNIGPDDEIIAPTYVCTAVLNAIFLAGARPVLVDIDDTHLGLSVDSVRGRVSEHTAAIILVHSYGLPCNPEPFRDIGVPIIEDCAQALGTEIAEGMPAGTAGDLTVFSFYATKPIAGGYGGALVSRDSAMIARAHDYLEFDCPEQYYPRFNFQLSDINAAVALSQFHRLPRFLARRREIASRYAATLATRPQLAKSNDSAGSNNFRFLLQFESEPECLACRDFLANRNIGSIRPLEPRELLHRYLGQDASAFPVAERVAATTLSIPVFPCLTENEIQRVCSALEAWLKP